MPAKSDTNLFDLIKSLSKKEKAELDKKFFSNKKNTTYYKVYQHIDKKQQEYDEIELIKKCKIEPKKFPGVKNYLYNTILFNLETIHFKEIENTSLITSISKIYILMNKGLFSQCQKLTEKYISKAYQREDYLSLLQLFEIRDQIKARFTAGFPSEESFQDSFDEHMNAYNNYLDVAIYKYQLLKTITPSLLTTVDKELHLGKSLREPSADTFLKKILHYRFLSRKNMVLGNFEDVIKINDTLLELIDDNNRKVYIPQTWVLGIHNTRIAAFINIGKYKDALRHFTETESSFKTLSDEEKVNEVTFQNLKFMLFCIVGKFDEAIELGDKFLTGTYRKIRLSAPELNVSCLYYLAYAYLGKGDLKKCLSIINELLSLSKSKMVRIDYLSNTRMLELIVNIERGEFELINSSLIRAWYRILKANNLDSEVNMAIYNCIKELAKASDPESNKIFIKYKKEITALFKEKNYFVYAKQFDILSWIEAKITSVPFAEIASKKQFT